MNRRGQSVFVSSNIACACGSNSSPNIKMLYNGKATEYISTTDDSEPNE